MLSGAKLREMEIRRKESITTRTFLSSLDVLRIDIIYFA